MTENRWRALRTMTYAWVPWWRARHVIPRGAQAWIGDIAIAFAGRTGDAADLVVHGDRHEATDVPARVGTTVRAGPYDVTVTGFGRRHGVEVVRLVVSVPKG